MSKPAGFKGSFFRSNLRIGCRKKGTGETRRGVAIDAKEKLLLAAQRNPDAVAFGYVAGHWVASA